MHNSSKAGHWKSIIFPGNIIDFSEDDPRGIRLPRGTTANRPAVPDNGTIRYNETTDLIEGYSNTGWSDIAGTGGGGTAISSVNGQTGAVVLTTTDIIASTDRNYISDVDAVKLASVVMGASDDQTGAEIKTAYEAEADTNAFTDADVTKLAGIDAAATADQTGAEIKTAYEANTNTNAFTDGDVTKLNGVEVGATADTDALNTAEFTTAMDAALA